MLACLIRILVVCVSILLPSIAKAEEKQRSNSQAEFDRVLKRAHDGLERLDKMLREAHPALMKLPNVQAWYLVQGDGSIKLLRGKEHRRHQQQWQLLKLIVDKPIQEVFTTFVVYSTLQQDANGYTSVAGVVPTAINPARHGIAINQVLFEKEDILLRGTAFARLVPTFLHEYMGHLRHPVSTFDGIDQHGCMRNPQKADALLKGFAELFWTHCTRNEVRKKLNINEYVSEYAAKDVNEDLPETIVAFIFCDKPRRDAQSIVANKIRYLWGDTELVSERTRVRDALRASRAFGPLVPTLQKPQSHRCS